MTRQQREAEGELYDPTYLHAHREAAIIILVWCLCLVWTTVYGGIFGYRLPQPEVSITFGMPTWIVWEIFAPWGLATLFTVWFALFYMADDDLGELKEQQEHDVATIRQNSGGRP